MIALRNVGSGVAMNVTGWLSTRFNAEQAWHRSGLLTNLFGGGDVLGVRITDHRVGVWDGAYGLIEFEDTAGMPYRCSWKLAGTESAKRSVEIVDFGPADQVPDPEAPDPLASPAAA